MNRMTVIAERIELRRASGTYTPPNEGQGNTNWLLTGGLLVGAAALFWVGRPSCRDARVRAGGDCW